MTIETALYTHLQTQSSVTALVGTRIYNARRPRQAGDSALTIANLGGPGVYHLEDELEKTQKTLDISTWAKGHTASADVESIYEAVRVKISSFRGYWGTVYVDSCTLEAGSGTVIPLFQKPEASDYWEFRKIMNVLITYTQAATSWKS
jgi:hypothetical protein